MKKIIKDSIHVRRLTRYQLIRKIINEKYLKYWYAFQEDFTWEDKWKK